MQTFKVNDKFKTMINQFRVSKSTMVFESSIVSFLNNYCKMKKSLLSLHILNNNFKIIKDMVVNLNSIFSLNILNYFKMFLLKSEEKAKISSFFTCF